jgi:hypothetical protein
VGAGEPVFGNAEGRVVGGQGAAREDDSFVSVIGVQLELRMRMIAVVETEEFLADVKGVLTEDEHDALILYGTVS